MSITLPFLRILLHWFLAVLLQFLLRHLFFLVPRRPRLLLISIWFLPWRLLRISKWGSVCTQPERFRALFLRQLFQLPFLLPVGPLSLLWVRRRFLVLLGWGSFVCSFVFWSQWTLFADFTADKCSSSCLRSFYMSNSCFKALIKIVSPATNELLGKMTFLTMRVHLTEFLWVNLVNWFQWWSLGFHQMTWSRSFESWCTVFLQKPETPVVYSLITQTKWSGWASTEHLLRHNTAAVRFFLETGLLSTMMHQTPKLTLKSERTLFWT